ncbi:MAG: tRNA (adenosine(37)-N6)-dimethylallyltransferase MiaA [Desulfuromonadales bacterium]|nr:tRNA (adenosine(37)-N6)-dimethylallyltransferase MiaA [Desulfuromonadales bacterium]
MTTTTDTQPSLPIICGPTAVGKTSVAIELAEYFGAEIISADSRQVYRLMDVGTAKATAQEQGRVKHHLLDVVWPDQEFNASTFTQQAKAAFEQIQSQGKRPFLVGGTGLYIKALTEGLLQAPGADPKVRQQLKDRAAIEGSAALHQELQGVDPECAAKLHPNDLIRVSRALEVFHQTGKPLSLFQKEHAFGDSPYRTLKIGLTLERETLYTRIDRRAEMMFDSGLLDEAQGLLDAGYSPELKALKTIGYRQAFALLRDEMTHQEAVEDLKRATRRYAKQQLTWFRGDKSIIWVDSSADFVTIRTLIEQFYDV